VDLEREYPIDPTKYFSTHLKPVDGIQAVLEKLTVPVLCCIQWPQDKNKKRNLATAVYCPFLMIISTACYDIDKMEARSAILFTCFSSYGFLPMNVLVKKIPIRDACSPRSGGFDVYGYDLHNERSQF